MAKRVLNVFLFLCLVCSLQANDYKISGVVIDEAGEPLPSATVLLFKGDNTEFNTGETTDLEGRFDFIHLEEGDYRIEISYVGFKTRTIRTRLNEEKPAARYNKIILKEDAALLTAVEVSAKRSSLQVDIDKKTFIVNESAVSEGTSVSEVLKEIPSVNVDVEGNVSLRNSENVEIYINGKPSGLTQENRGDILEQLPAGSLEKVEVITNPSSKYDAEGSAGIINIVMKNNGTEATYYGSVAAGITYPWRSKPGGNASATININKGKWMTSASIGYTNRRSIGEGINNRQNFGEGEDTTYTNQTNKTNFNMNTVFVRLSTNCQIDSANNIGTSGMLSYGNRDRFQEIQYERGDLMHAAEIPSSFQNRNSSIDNDRISGNAALDYKHSFAPNNDLSLSFNFSANKSKTDRLYEQESLDMDHHALNELDYTQDQYTISRNRNYGAQIDYSTIFSNSAKFEAGAKLSFQNQYDDVDSYIKRIEEEGFVPQEELDNDFEMHQNVYALYASYGQKFHRFAMQLGLRGEVTDPDWTLNTTGESCTKKPYFDVFPTAFFSYAFSETNELQLSYTRRISRPRQRWINPYVDVSDSTNIRFGNPDLDPEYANMIELNYIKTFNKHTFTTSLYYQLVQDVVQQYKWRTDESMISTFANMTKSHSAGLELILKDSWKYVSLTTNFNLYYYKLMGGNFSIATVYNNEEQIVDVNIKDRQSFSWTGKVSADFSLPKDFALQVTGNYRSPRATAQGKTLHTYTINMGLKKTFLQKRLVATLSVRDLLDSRKNTEESRGDNFYQYSKSSWSGRTLNLNVSYNFGNMKKKYGGKKGGKDDRGGYDDDSVFDDF